MVAERVEGLYEVLRQPEVLLHGNSVRPFEDMSHLECYGLDEAFGVLCKVLVRWRGWSLLRPNLQYLLYLLQNLHYAQITTEL